MGFVLGLIISMMLIVCLVLFNIFARGCNCLGSCTLLCGDITNAAVYIWVSDKHTDSYSSGNSRRQRC